MKVKKKISSSVYLSIVFILSFSCTTDPTVNDPDLNTTKEINFAANLSEDVNTQVDYALDASTEILGNQNKNFIDTSCASISIFPNDSTWPKTITMDYGPVNCLGSDGNYRRGIIEIEVSAPFFLPGTVHDISFLSYFFNDNQIEGYITRTNGTLNANNNPVVSLEENLTITKPDSTQISRSASHLREMIEGTLTPQYHWDDVFLISGFSSGNNSLGISFADTIISPLERAVNCQWIKSGERQITRPNGNQFALNYGNGLCDPLATLTVNGNSFPINLN